MYPNWGFCSIWFILMKLACLVDWFGHFKLLSIKYNDLILSNYWISENGFSNFGVFDISSMLKPILWFWTKIELFLTALEHVSCVNNVHASYRNVISIFFMLTCSLPLVFLVSFLVLFYLSSSLASCLGKLEPIGPPLLFLPLPLIVRGSWVRKTRKRLRSLTLGETFRLRERFF